MKSITSLQNPLIKLAASLHQKKYRDEENLFLVEGAEMIAMALEKKWQLHTLFLSDAQKNPFTDHDEESIVVSKEILEKITKKENPQNAVALFHKRLETVIPDNRDQIILPALEEIRDPGNLGTIMRTCHALGLNYLLLIGNCVDPFSPETIRASMGAFSAVTIVHVSEKDVSTWKKSHADIPFIATDVVQATDYRDMDYKNAVLLMGNEQKGVSPLLKTLCDRHVKIPMPGGAESLNVAMATTLLLYEAMRPSL